MLFSFLLFKIHFAGIVILFNSFVEYGAIHKHNKTDEVTRKQVLQRNDGPINSNFMKS